MSNLNKYTPKNLKKIIKSKKNSEKKFKKKGKKKHIFRTTKRR